MMPRTVSLAVLVALALSTAVPGLASAADVPLEGSDVRITDSPRPQGRRNLVGLADANVDLSGVDPTVAGATIHIGPDAGPATVLDLPASGWNRTGNAPRIDFKYKSRTGAVRAARLIDGRSIRFTAKGAEAFALGGASQSEVAVTIDIGGMRFCGAFGGTITRNDGQRFTAKNAPAPASCSAFGATTTTSSSSTSTSSTSTSSTTATTSSTTTTTRPYTFVQSYTNNCVPFNYLNIFGNFGTFASADAARAACVVLCDETPGCVKIWTAHDCDGGSTPSWCLLSAVDTGNSDKGWASNEIQCSYPPIPACAEWYDLAVP
jgi:hypothetical protein